MKNIALRLEALERRIKTKDITGEYCRQHAPAPFLILPGSEIPPPDLIACPICGKPYPPEIPHVIIAFADETEKE